MGTRTIDTTDEADVWRYRCPAGHTSWEPTNAHLWCPACARAAKRGVDVEPEFDALLDTRADELVPRSELRLEGPRAIA